MASIRRRCIAIPMARSRAPVSIARCWKTLSARNDGSAHVAVEVKPPPILTYEAAEFVLAMGGAAAMARACDELHRGLSGIGSTGGLLDIQAQPADARIQRKRRRPRGRMPRRQQVVGQSKDERAVARSHQRFGIRRGKTAVIAAAAGVVAGFSAGAKAHGVRRQMMHRLFAGIARSSTSSNPALAASASTASKSRMAMWVLRACSQSLNVALLELVNCPL